ILPTSACVVQVFLRGDRRDKYSSARLGKQQYNWVRRRQSRYWHPVPAQDGPSAPSSAAARDQAFRSRNKGDRNRDFSWSTPRAIRPDGSRLLPPEAHEV